MRNLTSDFGDKAGKIYKALEQYGPMKKEKILEITDLNENEFHTAVGWLAREDKIYEEEQYKIQNTNLTERVGSSAGKVWKVMDVWGEVDILTIRRIAKIPEKEIHTAIGWLAREDKIVADEQTRKFNLK